MSADNVPHAGAQLPRQELPNVTSAMVEKACCIGDTVKGRQIVH